MYVVQAGLKLSLLSTRITGMYHHTQLLLKLLFSISGKLPSVPIYFITTLKNHL
jgi:hypothetical protein